MLDGLASKFARQSARKTQSISLLMCALRSALARSDLQGSAGFFTLSAVSMRLSQVKLEPVDLIDSY
jgi:hypothetical protein